MVCIINANDWQIIYEQQGVCYYSGCYYPPDCPWESMNLPFSWVRVDTLSGAITAARDHFGQEPLYYTFDKNRFIFGTTIRDILKHLPKKPEFTEHLITDCYLRFPVGDPLDDPPYTNETYYKGIFRVTPGHVATITLEDKTEQPFWQLDPNQPTLNYKDEHEYIDHFSMLLAEAIKITTQGEHELALEFSGGMDSTAIFATCIKMGLKPYLFRHIPPSSRKKTNEDLNVHQIITQFAWEDKYFPVNADSFDPITVFKHYAHLFQSPPPNMNCVLAHNVYEAINDRGLRTVISGYGGDDGVSLLFPLSVIAKSTTHLRTYEVDLLHGLICHEMRMRLEYSVIATKAMGLKYVYPLLYPPLVEFCFSVPFEMKFKNGTMRYIMQQYLKQHIGFMNFSTKDGAFVPSTMQKCRDYFKLGLFHPFFVDLPLQNYSDERTDLDDKLLLQIHSFMLKQVLEMGACIFA